jgi:hypothetical protein
MNRSILLAVPMILLLAVPLPAEASLREKMRKELAPLVARVLELGKENNQQTVAVGQFTGPAQVKTSLGDGLEQLVIEELERLKAGCVNSNSGFSIKGEYDISEVMAPDASGQPVKKLFFRLEITPRLTDKGKLGSLETVIKDSELIAALQGSTIHLPPAHTSDQLNAALKFALEERQKKEGPLTFFLSPDGKQIGTVEKSPYRVEVLVAKKGTAPKNVEEWGKVDSRAFTKTEREPTLPLAPGELYALRLTNQSAFDAAVGIAVDGVDVFQLSTIRTPDGKPRYTNYIVPPGTSILVTGWHLDNRTVASFLVTGFHESVAAKLNRHDQGKIGTITITFAAAWKKDGQRPEDEGGRGGSGTGTGPESEMKVQEVERSIGVIRDVVTIRYDR